MTKIIDTTSQRRLPAKLVVGIATCALLALGTFAGLASAGETGGSEYAPHYYNGGYYQALPVVYGSPYGGAYYGSPYYNGSPYYYAPPVVYGASIGVSLPFIGIGIR
jgi:hypothetical protein